MLVECRALPSGSSSLGAGDDELVEGPEEGEERGATAEDPVGQRPLRHRVEHRSIQSPGAGAYLRAESLRPPTLEGNRTTFQPMRARSAEGQLLDAHARRVERWPVSVAGAAGVGW